jgi:hypothetical protein
VRSSSKPGTTPLIVADTGRADNPTFLFSSSGESRATPDRNPKGRDPFGARFMRAGTGPNRPLSDPHSAPRPPNADLSRSIDRSFSPHSNLLSVFPGEVVSETLAAPIGASSACMDAPTRPATVGAKSMRYAVRASGMSASRTPARKTLSSTAVMSRPTAFRASERASPKGARGRAGTVAAWHHWT